MRLQKHIIKNEVPVDKVSNDTKTKILEEQDKYF